jgi:hypothetical protein
MKIHKVNLGAETDGTTKKVFLKIQVPDGARRLLAPPTKHRRDPGTGCLYKNPGSDIWQIQIWKGGSTFWQSTHTRSRRATERFLMRKLRRAPNG